MRARKRKCGASMRDHRDYLRYLADRKKMSRIQRQCRTACEERILGTANRNPKAHYNYVQSRAASQRAVCGVRKHKGTTSAGIQKKADRLLELFRAAYRRNQEKQRKPLGLVTLLVEMPIEAITEKEMWDSLEKLGISKAAGPNGI